MLPLNHHETHYSRQLRDKLNCGNWVIKKAIRIEGLTTTDGVADIIGWTNDGHFAAIEVKKPENTTSKLQEMFLDEAPYAWVAVIQKNDKKEVHAYLSAWKGKGIDTSIYLGRER